MSPGCITPGGQHQEHHHRTVGSAANIVNSKRTSFLLFGDARTVVENDVHLALAPSTPCLVSPFRLSGQLCTSRPLGSPTMPPEKAGAAHRTCAHALVQGQCRRQCGGREGVHERDHAETIDQTTPGWKWGGREGTQEHAKSSHSATGQCSLLGGVGELQCLS